MGRSVRKELLDLGPSHYTAEEYTDCLIQLGRVGHLFGAQKATLRAFDHFFPKTILEVGSGGGFFANQLGVRYPNADIVAIDLNEQATALANQLKVAPNVRFKVQPEPSLHYAANAFEIVTCTLVCHHMTDEELVAFLQQAARTASKALIINDLHRSLWAYLCFAISAPFLFRNRLITHDGKLSIKRAFKKKELKKALIAAGLRKWTIRWQFPFRWVITVDLEDQ